MATVLRRIIPTLQLAQQCRIRALCTTNKLNTMWENDDKGGYKTALPLPPFRERMRIGLEELKKEVKLWCEEMKERIDMDPVLVLRPGETDVVFDFKNEDSLNKWIVTCDADHNEGYSHCSFTRNAFGNGVFSGHINLRVPKDGRVKRSGYCNIRTVRARKPFKREGYYNWGGYNALVMKVRGDGRTYLLNLLSRGAFDITWNDQFHYQLYTRGGPYWQIVKIPFSRFFLASKGRVQDTQSPVRLDRITAFGISAQDRHGGDFHLEIAYIGLEYESRFDEEFAYEKYKLARGIAQV